MAKTYISILRGINVSGKHLIKMKELEALYKACGFENVITYIQSGNVVFRAAAKSPDDLADMIREKIKESFQFDIAVQVFSLEDFKKLAAGNPFSKEKDKEEKFLHFTFLKGAARLPEKSDLEKHLSAGEAFFIKTGIIYLYCPGGYGNTKLHNNFLEKKCQGQCTTRNYNTVQKLISFGEEMQK